MRLVALLTLISLVSEVRYCTLKSYVTQVNLSNRRTLNDLSEDANNLRGQSSSTRGSARWHLGPGAVITSRFRSARMKLRREDHRILGSFNCQGLLTSEVKRRSLADDFERKNLDILAVQETHLRNHGVIELQSFSNKRYNLYYSGNKTESERGVGFIVDSKREVKFLPISDRICKLTTKINNTDTLEMICAYAPTLANSEAKPELRDNFYAELDSVIQKTKSRNALIIAGDFNAKTGSAFQDELYKNVIGKYGKGTVNSNGIHLLNFTKLHNLRLANTFFKHKPSQTSTWEEPNHIAERIDATTKTVRRVPYRNQVDYICVSNNFRGINVLDAHSVSGMATTSDHKLIIMKCVFKWPYTKTSKSQNVNFNCEKLSDINIRAAYQQEVTALLTSSTPASNNQERWNNIVNATTTAAKNIIGLRSRAKQSTNEDVIKLSGEQKRLKQQIDCSKDMHRRRILRQTRNNKLHQIHDLLLAEQSEQVDKKIELIEREKDDSRKMFSVIKELYREKPKTPLLIQTGEGSLTANPAEQCKLIAAHFKELFFKDVEPIRATNPQAMRKPFTRDEISQAIMKLRNNRSSGLDNVTAELLKYGPEILSNEIALIYNCLAETGDCPLEITQGLLCALQKPGKTKGPLDHLRPIILLSMLRKVLAICLKDRTIDRIDSQIPPSQAAYRKGRSTTEHVFAVKVLCEKAMSSRDYTIYLRLLDMSKAFDSVNRTLLIRGLEKVLEADEVNLIRTMLNVELSVRCGKEKSDFFPTDTGVPQGDGYSANEFTYYLADSLDTEQHFDHNYCLPHNNADHDYAAPIATVEVDLDMEYADDITYVTTCGTLFTIKRGEIPARLAPRNLTVNMTKTEEYVVSRNGDKLWRKCKLLGSLLGTAEDIVRRKGLAAAAIQSKKDVFYSRMDTELKMRAFNCYVASIFLYNCELWGLTQTQCDAIDAYQRRLLRTAVLNVRWPQKVTNVEVYEKTGAIRWSDVIQARQLSWFGHLIRLRDDTPAKIALKNALKVARRPAGRPPTTWLSHMKNLFSSMGMSWETAVEAAKDRKLWSDITT